MQIILREHFFKINLKRKSTVIIKENIFVLFFFLSKVIHTGLAHNIFASSLPLHFCVSYYIFLNIFISLFKVLLIYYYY